MHKKEEKREKPFWKSLVEEEGKYQDYEFPKVSIIIPTSNAEEKIDITIEHALMQDYPDFEIIVVDAGSDDRTLESIKNYRDDRIAFYSVSEYHRYEMLNKGISQTGGMYINILFPGDFYIHTHVLRHMMACALDRELPHGIYCGTLIRGGRSDVKILFRELSLKNLRKGLQPTSLQSFWFHRELFREIGKFHRRYQLRGGYELMCRICLNPNMKIVSTNRVLTDYDLRKVTRKMVLCHFRETWATISRFFGLFAALRWLTIQKDLSRYVTLWLRNLKVAFFGRG